MSKHESSGVSIELCPATTAYFHTGFTWWIEVCTLKQTKKPQTKQKKGQ